MKYQTYTKQQKWSLVQRIDGSRNKARELSKLGLSRSTYYDWKRNNCESKKKAPKTVWNKVPKEIEEKIRGYRESGEMEKQSPARIVEQLERNEGYIISESGVKSVLVRLKLNGTMRPRRKRYHIRPKAEKFLEVVCVDDVEFIRRKPRDTYVLNFSDEASYMALESRVFEHRVNAFDIIKGLKKVYEIYGRYPKTIRLDNARAHKAKKVLKFCLKKNIKIDYITKGCPEENWPVESWHRNLNQDLIYRKGFDTIKEWQAAVDEYRHFHNYEKRLRSDPIQRTPHEIAFAYTTLLTQARIKTRIKRKLFGQASVNKWIPKEAMQADSFMLKSLQEITNQVSEMCVS